MAPKNFATDIEDAIYQSAVQHAQAEGKSVEDVLTGLMLGYARTGSTGSGVPSGPRGSAPSTPSRSKSTDRTAASPRGVSGSRQRRTGAR